MRGYLVIAVLAPAAAAGEVRFTSKPSARRVRGKTEISFAVSAPTDVEVAVLDSRGKIVRHLAAGMLGAKAPEPFKRGLRQEIEWDGKDDLGRPAAGGPFKVRVALGLRPRLEKVIGHNPAALGAIVALAADPRNGELFVFHLSGALHPNDGSVTCSVFSREGKYLRTILPWPANLPEEKLKGLRRVRIEKGVKVPFIYQAETRSLIPGAGELVLNGPVVTTDGRLAFVGHQEGCGTATRYNHPGIKQVTVINTDGSMPESGVLKTVLARSSQAAPMLALSPDEKTFYAAEVGEGYGGKKLKSRHAVHKFGWDDAVSRPFIGDPAAPGAGGDKLNEPADVAVDGKGNIYVADRGNDRVAVFKPNGSYLGEIKVAKPKRVEVHPGTGAVYVLSGDDKTNDLWKFASWKGSSPAARAKLPSFRYPRPMAMALDASAEPAVLWVASPGSNYAVPPFKLLRIEDKGASFGERVDIAKLPENRKFSVGAVMLLSLDRRQNRLYINDKVYDVALGRFSSGVRGTDGKKRGMGSVGLDGNLYLMGYSRWLRRYGPDLKLLPFPEGAGEKGSLEGPEGCGTLRLRTRGVTADPLGNIYALWQFPEGGAASHGNTNYVTLHAPDGAVKKKKFIDSDTRAICSPRLDCRGNIYLALGARPEGKDVPDSFKGQDLGKPWKYGINTNDINWYHLMYGCIVKFGPEGGTIRKGSGGAPVTFSYRRQTEIKGAEWIFYGASPVPSWRMKYPDTCLCESSRFDVDGFGRSFFPDVARFRVGVLDTGGNLICWFGSYGNQDSAGPKSAVPEPEIAVLWPDNIAVGDGVVYLGDRLNKRVLAVKLEHAAEAACSVR